MDCVKKRVIIRAGRRGGKTVGIAIKAVKAFLAGKRVLYAAPTGEQTDRFWFEIKRALQPLVDAGVCKLNETERYVEKPGTENRIKAKTAWNANTLRGDYADLLILDEWQLMAEDTWDDVGAPMLLDNNGDAVFIYTPPSLKSTGISRAQDPRHAAKMFKAAMADTAGRWQAFHFTSHDNPYVSEEALAEITQDMSKESYLKEIMAEDDDSQVNLLVLGCFNENVCRLPSTFPLPPEWLIYTGHDFGTANPGALFASQSPAGDIYIWQEYAPTVGKSTYQNVEAFRETVKGRTVVKSVGGSHQEQEVRQAYISQGWSIMEPHISGIRAQIDRVKQFMEKNKVFILSNCNGLLNQINSCMWVLGPDGKPTNDIKDEKKYHLIASLRYLITCFSPETTQGQSVMAVQRQTRYADQGMTVQRMR